MTVYYLILFGLTLKTFNCKSFCRINNLVSQHITLIALFKEPLFLEDKAISGCGNG